MRNHRGGEKIAGNLMMNEAVAIPPLFLFPLISTDTPCTNTANRRAPRESERDRDKERVKKEIKAMPSLPMSALLMSGSVICK